jgi:UDP-N-acetylglucosamine--N-acetylmuramyl-(pentapeptide) pyrophosphoryl-undecaprenol N-acetylglucosamine transferase
MSIIIITGGHHNSALVVAKELISRGHKVIWLGHRYSSRGDTVDSAEYIEVKAAGIQFHHLVAARMVLDIRELLRFPRGLAQTFTLLRKIRPASILSFGGYLGGTVSLVGKMLGIPIYLHEQTVTAGRANKLIGRLARKVYLTWADSAKYFDSGKTKLVGLPLRQGIITAKSKPFFTRRRPTLLIMGGKQGAHALNQFVFDHLSALLTDFNLLHQTGTSSHTHDYDSAISLQNSLGSLADSYLPVGYISESKIGVYLRSSDLYFGRSGAHITYELGVTGLKSILVPLMSTHDHEQHKNAQILVKAKQAVILAESQLGYEHFGEVIKQVGSLKSKKLKLARNAADLLVNDLLADLKDQE